MNEYNPRRINAKLAAIKKGGFMTLKRLSGKLCRISKEITQSNGMMLFYIDVQDEESFELTIPTVKVESFLNEWGIIGIENIGSDLTNEVDVVEKPEAVIQKKEPESAPLMVGIKLDGVFSPLRQTLFDSIEALKAGKMDVGTAKQISNTSQTIINSVKIELEIRKFSKQR